MNSQKHLFSLEPTIHYLNCGYKSPLLKSAEKATIEALIRDRNPSYITPDDFFDQVIEVRELFGKLINCPARNIAIIPSSSYGFASVLNNVKPKFDGNAITIKNEFPSGYFSLERWCDLNDNDFIVIEPEENSSAEDWNTKIINSITEDTSVVLISSIHWMNGLKFNLKAIGLKCKEVGAKFIVDGTQSVGAIPLDISQTPIDALVCASYKWLFGTYSIAFAYISDDFDKGIPLEESYMNRTNGRNFAKLTDYEPNYMPSAGRYNMGQASNLIAMPIVHEGLKQLLKWGVQNIDLYCKKQIEPLLNFFTSIDIKLENDLFRSNHLVGVKLPKQFDTKKLIEIFGENKVFVSFRGESLRVSVNVFNDEEDIQTLIESIKQSQ